MLGILAQGAAGWFDGRTAMNRFLPCLAIALLAAGCAGAPTKVPPAATAGVRDSIAALALSMVGVPYRYGGVDPHEGFDCSGLVFYTYTSSGQTVPRTSGLQFEAARKIDLEEAAKGDLLFFSDQEKLSHVGIYLGDGRFVHAPSSGGHVRVEDVDAPYYRQHLVAVGQLLP
jgi:cell wall-associated NlpC family hydrolase